MYNQYFRFFDKVNEFYFDVLFDSRLSFIENFELLGEINIQDKLIFDEKLLIVLDKNIPIGDFHFPFFYPLSIC